MHECRGSMGAFVGYLSHTHRMGPADHDGHRHSRMLVYTTKKTARAAAAGPGDQSPRQGAASVLLKDWIIMGAMCMYICVWVGGWVQARPMDRHHHPTHTYVSNPRHPSFPTTTPKPTGGRRARAGVGGEPGRGGDGHLAVLPRGGAREVSYGVCLLCGCFGVWCCMCVCVYIPMPYKSAPVALFNPFE